MSWLFILVVVLLIGLLVGIVDKYGAEYIDAKYIKLFKFLAIVGTIIWLFFVTGAYDFLAGMGGPRHR
jgi:uncharacterized membrane protein